MKDRDARPPSTMDYVGGLIFGIIVLALVLGGRLIQIILFPLWLPVWLILRLKKPAPRLSHCIGGML